MQEESPQATTNWQGSRTCRVALNARKPPRALRKDQYNRGNILHIKFFTCNADAEPCDAALGPALRMCPALSKKSQKFLARVYVSKSNQCAHNYILVPAITIPQTLSPKRPSAI